MNVDYSAILDNFIAPVVMFFLVAFGMLGWALAIQLNKEVTDLRIRLGREAEEEPRRKTFLILKENVIYINTLLIEKFREQKNEYTTALQQISFNVLRPALIQLVSIIIFKIIINARSIVSVFRS